MNRWIGLAGKLRPHILPSRSRREQHRQLTDRQIRRERVPRRHRHSQSIRTYPELDRIPPDRHTRLNLLVLDRPRRIRDIRLTGHAESLEAGPRTDRIDSDQTRIALILEPCRHHLRQREHRRRARNRNILRDRQRINRIQDPILIHGLRCFDDGLGTGRPGG